MSNSIHKSGYVNIIGNPNVGKSTLMNVLVKERMSIITRKPQTTRHRILGILSGEDFQIIFSDTPGIITHPAYKMQNAMNSFAYSSFEDADIILYVVDVNEEVEVQEKLAKNLKSCKAPVFLIINKIDTVDEGVVKEKIETLKTSIPSDQVFSISALHKVGTDELFNSIKEALPEGPVYYPKDQLTDRPEKFFIAEIIRENILELYHQEIPYCSEVHINEYKEDEDIIRIYAYIYVSRKTQKSIIIGKGGSAIKQLGIQSRKDIEEFVSKKVFLELYVKVQENWRDNDRQLKSFGYSN